MPPIFYIMGPSGAGKDSLLRFARARLAPEQKIAFAHRYITRPPDSDDENHVALSDTEFEARRAADLFAYHWQASGFRYGIGIEIDGWRRAGFIVVLSGSRAHFATLRPCPSDIVPVLVTAPPMVLSARLLRRGRETEDAVERRLQRAENYSVESPGIIVIDNSGPLDRAGFLFLDLLHRAASSLRR